MYGNAVGPAAATSIGGTAAATSAYSMNGVFAVIALFTLIMAFFALTRAGRHAMLGLVRKR